MKSSDLAEFSSWQKWGTGLPSHAPNQPGVYAFRLAGGAFGRIKGDSDLVYIGCTEGTKRSIRQRLKDHLVDRPDKEDIGHRLRRVEREVGELAVAWRTCDNADEAMQFESRLLAKYAHEHIEFPPLNRKEPGKKFRKALELLQPQSPDKSPEEIERQLRSVAKRKAT